MPRKFCAFLQILVVLAEKQKTLNSQFAGFKAFKQDF